MATYSLPEVEQYLKHIDYPDPLKAEFTAKPFPSLTKLIMRHLTTIPFDSLALHYSRTRQISLAPDDLFTKIVVKARGGYCMELNTFFATILRTLGFQLHLVGARVNTGHGFTHWDHQALIVTIAEQRYLVDVGFGSHTPIAPIPLEDGAQISSLAPAEGKLEFKAIAEHTDPGQRLWVYSTRPSAKHKDGEQGWTDRYAFAETEWFPADFLPIHLYMSTMPQSFFVQTVVAVKMAMGAGAEIQSQTVLCRDYVKTRLAGQSEGEVVERLRDEEERVKALESWFGVRLSERERSGIRGLASELRGREMDAV